MQPTAIDITVAAIRVVFACRLWLCETPDLCECVCTAVWMLSTDLFLADD